tara:strand:- start:1210 stop:3459 length:2250 start_codon:yes stop_codon:yes gene_type:complete
MKWEFACTILFVILFIDKSSAQNCIGDSRCQSQLLQVTLSPNVLGGNSSSLLLPLMQELASSPELKNNIIGSFPIPNLGFPPLLTACLREQEEGDPDFAGIDCREPNLCSQPQLPDRVKNRICFNFPCTILEGPLLAGACNDVKAIFPTNLKPDDVVVERAEFNPTSLNVSETDLEMCFTVTDLAVSTSLEITLDTEGTDLPGNIFNLSKIAAELDEPRNICVRADYNIASPTPISNLQIISEVEHFISIPMLQNGARNVELSGLEGYPEGSFERVRSALPRLVRPVQLSVEGSIKDALASVFEEEITKKVQTLAPPIGQSYFVHRNEVLSDIAGANLDMRREMDMLECALIMEGEGVVPDHHPCMRRHPDEGWRTEGFDAEQRRNYIKRWERMVFVMPDIARAVREQNLTSPYLERRLEGLKDLIRARTVNGTNDPETMERMSDAVRNSLPEGLQRRNARDIADIDEVIANLNMNQAATTVEDFVEIQRVLSGDGLSVGAAMAGVCDTLNPSSFTGRSMEGCPIQIYSDLGEMNNLLDHMWQTGELCTRGAGRFIPELRDNRWVVRDRENGNRPVGNDGCYLYLENRLGCYLESAPRIEFDSRAGNYKVSVDMEHCHRPNESFLGLEAPGTWFGMDFDVVATGNPTICHGGDFCLEDVDVDYTIVEGTEAGGLRSSGLLGLLFDVDVPGEIRGQLEESIANAVNSSIRVPMSSTIPTLRGFTIRPTGQIDKGPEYFGVCMELTRGVEE